MSQDEKEGSEIMKLEIAKVCEKSVIAKPGRQSQHPQATVQFSRAVLSTLRPHGLQHTRLPCPSPTPGACSNSCPLSQ